MINGIWSAKFFLSASTSEAFDAGIMVFSHSTINGGNSSYYYTGFYQAQGRQLLADIAISHYSGHYKAEFGEEVDQLSITLSGDIHPDEFELLGTSASLKQAIVIKLKHLSDL